MRKKWVLAGIACIILCLVAGSTFINYQEKKERQSKAEQIFNAVKPEIAVHLNADSYALSVSDYNKLMSIKNQALRQRKLSDKELNWTLSLLKPSAPEMLHYRVFAILQLLGNAPAHQKDAIKSAIQPYLNQSDPRYHNSMKRLQKFVFGNPNWQPPK